MRALKAKDLGRFGYFVRTSKAGPVIDKIFEMANTEAAARRKHLFELDKAAKGGDEFAKAEFDRINADQNWIFAIGLRGALMLADCAAEHGAMDSMYKFLAPVWEMTPAEIEEMSLTDFKDQLLAMVKGNDTASFFDAARRTGIL